MGQSKQWFEESREEGYISLEMTISFYEQNQDLLTSEDVRIKSAYRKNKTTSNDKEHKEKIDALITAKNELLEYEVKMRYKQPIKLEK